MMSKQSVLAVEWLVEELQKSYNISIDIKNTVAYNTAIGMEKEQINKAFYDGYYQEELCDARRYYNDTYGDNAINVDSILNK